MQGMQGLSKTKLMTHAKTIHVSQVWRERLLIFLFYALLAAAVLAPIASDQAMSNLADFLVHLASIIQAKAALIEGQFPLRVMPLEHFGWRYPYYQFYSPSIYLIAGSIYRWLTPHNPLIAFKITLWCGILVGGIYMYRLAYWFVQSKVAALLAGVAYLYAPYYIIIINRLGSLGEIVALGIVPAAIYYSLQRYFYPTQEKNLLVLGLIWYLLITIHVVTFVYASFFIGLLFVMVTIRNRKRVRNLLNVGIAYAFGCLLALWYIEPVISFKKYFIISYTYTDPQNINLFHPLLSHLLFSAAALTTGSRSALITIHPSIGWPILMAFCLSVYAYFNRESSGMKRADYWMPIWLVLFVISFFMAWSPVNFWNLLPQPLLVAQHCWRILSQLIWVGALLFAWATCYLFKKSLDLRHLVVGIFLIVMSANVWFPKTTFMPNNLADFVKKPYIIYSNNSYLLNFNKYTQFVDKIDSLLIDPTNRLKLNSPLTFPDILLRQAEQPTLELQANIPEKIAKLNLQLLASLNDREIAKIDLKQGPLLFQFPISIPAEKQSNQEQLQASVKFSLNKNENAAKIHIPMDKVLLTGFFKPEEHMDVKDMTPLCRQIRNITECKVIPKQGVKFLELPVLYYPHLLTVTLNGKRVAYQSVLYQGYLLTGVTPVPGENVVDVEFTGEFWANKISWVAWCLWVVLLIHVLYQKFRKSA